MKPLVIDVNINLNDVVTPKSCSFLICELIKHLIYQREQIPYTYDRLKFLITKRKEMLLKAKQKLYGVSSTVQEITDNILKQYSPPDEEEEKISLHTRIAAERHYTKAEETFINLENAFKIIQSEMEMLSKNTIDEIAVIFGSTPLHPQNVFRIPIPLLAFGHNESCHPSRKHLPSLFQSLVSSDGLNKLFNQKISPTNMFILLKMKDTLHPTSEMFLRKDNYSIPVRNSHISFILKDNLKNCCGCCSDSGIPIFCDTPSKHCNVVDNVIYTVPVTNKDTCLVESVSNRNDDNEFSSWFQFSDSIKGFKDLKLEGTSVANLWLKHTRPYGLTS